MDVREHMSRMYISSHYISLYLSAIYTYTQNKDALLLCLFVVAARIIHKDDGGFSLVVLVFLFF